jgi:1,2-diacylglycerol 3-alpha-glucosyltransferase
MSAERAPVKVLLAAPGLGWTQRGAETFTAECFAALRDDPRLDLVLARGAGARLEGTYRIRTLPRDSPWAIRVGSRLGGNGYTAEIWSFAVGLAPRLVRIRPHVVLVNDLLLARALRRWRSISQMHFRLILRNNTLAFRPPFPEIDFIQQLRPARLREALDAGEPSERQALVPSGFFLEDRVPLTDADARRGLRRKLRLPEDRGLVLSVALLDLRKGHERLIRACARSGRSPFLVMLGARSHGTGRVEEMAQSALGAENVTLRTVRSDEVADYYRCADVFANAVFVEGFGRAVVEAAAHGLPCVIHDGVHGHEVLGEWGSHVDTRDENAFAAAIDIALASSPGPQRNAQHQAMVALYDWANLRERYVAMFRAAASISLR